MCVPLFSVSTKKSLSTRSSWIFLFLKAFIGIIKMAWDGEKYKFQSNYSLGNFNAKTFFISRSSSPFRLHCNQSDKKKEKENQCLSVLFFSWKLSFRGIVLQPQKRRVKPSPSIKVGYFSRCVRCSFQFNRCWFSYSPTANVQRMLKELLIQSQLCLMFFFLSTAYANRQLRDGKLNSDKWIAAAITLKDGHEKRGKMEWKIEWESLQEIKLDVTVKTILNCYSYYFYCETFTCTKFHLAFSSPQTFQGIYIFTAEGEKCYQQHELQ